MTRFARNLTEVPLHRPASLKKSISSHVPDTEIFCNALRDAGQRDLRSGGGVRFDGVGDAFQLRSKAEARGHGISVGQAKAARQEAPGGYHPSSSHLSEKGCKAQRNFGRWVSEKENGPF